MDMSDSGKGLLASIRNYPPGVFFMLGNEFCERFSFYGMRAVLILYLITEHHFSESKASLFYHSFIAFAYISPLLGSIAADNYFGRFRVILWMSAIYVIGHVLLSVGAIPELNQSFRLIFDFGGLAVIAFATGGIKPCVSAFAADQFEEKQVYERNQFFSFFYFAINAGSLLAILLTPILRGRVKCFGSEYCFPLAFVLEPNQQQPLLISSKKSHLRDYCNMDMSDSGKGLLASIRNYPPGVFFMLGNEFCERFSFYGMRAVLILYLITEHHFSERYTNAILNV
ncbi:hypothetical protein WUBG_15192 [Wuchereria bancrofti]|uniref:POT family protein n=1 Tax=Wuchereria bancrofti TaxID=6293 RepID=J9EA75_WUCBA|nr:hypothetical protein WUBG_15192 [Wuchereria bancrofti]